jgi:hypothetical protein
LLNLLAFPAMVFLYYFKKYPKVTRRGVLGALGVSVGMVIFVLYIICPWTVKLGAWADLLFVNSFGLPVNSGIAVYAVALFALLGWGVWRSYQKRQVVWNTFLLMTTVIVLGYSSYASVIIRASVDPPMNSNNPDNPFGLMRLLSREQYGDRPLIHGQSYAAPLVENTSGRAYYIGDDGKYHFYETLTGTVYPSEFNMLFPRLYDASKEEQYKQWANITGRPVSYEGETYIVPTFGENLEYFFRYQLNFMYWRYFMWNFVGRQNDEQGSGGLLEGNWLSGINAIDALYLGPQDDLPESMTENKARNRYYFLPFILGILGVLTQLKRDKRGFAVVMWLFFMTGIAIILYLNQGPGEVRERDYAYAGSFYAFSIWIGLGLLWLYDALNRAMKRQPAAALAATMVCLSVPVLLCAENWDDHTRAHRYLARDIGRNYLESCLPNAILMDYGDNDTFPVWYNQEVEGVRPDVRVMNLSYLGGEWYIDQMRVKANDSEPVPFSLPKEKYYGENEGLPVEDLVKSATARQVIDFIRSDHPQSKIPVRSGAEYDFIPTRKILVPVDRENALASGIVRPEDAHLMADTLELNIPAERNSITRVEMMLIDLLANFDWKRPLYFTSLYPNAQAFGLENYIQSDGLAYRLVPIRTPYTSIYEAGRIDPEYLYDKLMNTFRYGNLHDPRVNVDYFSRYTIDATRIRNTFTRLSDTLLQQGDTLRARQLLGRLREEFPVSQLPPSLLYYEIQPLITMEAHYRAGEEKIGNGMLEEYAGRLRGMLSYLARLPENKRLHLARTVQSNLLLLNNLAGVAENYGQNDAAAEIDLFLENEESKRLLIWLQALGGI